MGAHNFGDLLHHVGHDIVCVIYGDLDSEYGDSAEGKMRRPRNVAVECETCGEVLLDFDRDTPVADTIQRTCQFCSKPAESDNSRWHGDAPVCNKCWDERLRITG